MRLLATALSTFMALALSALAFAEEKAPAGEGDAASAENQAESLEPSNFYVHRWIPLPSFTGTQLIGSGQRTVEAKKGRLTVIFFLASWCEPCQQLMPEFQKIETRYRRLDADFVYVFAHDTRDDAEGFMKEFGIKEGMLANHEILKAFHNPELPSIYVGDRHGWMLTRYLKAETAELAKLSGVLQTLTSY